MVAGVGEVEIILSVERKSGGKVELSADAGSIITGEARSASAGDSSENAGGEAEPSDDVVVCVCDVEVVGCVESETLRGVQSGSRGRPGRAGESLRTDASDDGDVTGSVYLADDVVGGLGYVEISCRIEDDCRREEKRNCRCGDGCLGYGLRDGKSAKYIKHEQIGDPKWSACAAMRVSEALRTHEVFFSNAMVGR